MGVLVKFMFWPHILLGPDDNYYSNLIGLLIPQVKSCLYSKRVIREYFLNIFSLHWLVKEINLWIYNSVVPNGEMVGAAAGQYLGEPTTQLTLNTFHSAGIATKELTLGVSRMLEIIEVRKIPKTPSLNLYLANNTSR